MKAKVFVIGFQKTGTTSLELALINLGYRVYGGDKNLFKFKDQKSLNNYILETLKYWDAVQDMPWPLFYKELHQLYPEAKFILTYRHTQDWIKSVVKYFASIRIPLHEKIYNVPCAEGYEQKYIDVYNNFNVEVIDFFKDKENFIIMEQNKNFNYETLCQFLNMPIVPKDLFPHARNNKKRKLPNYKWYRDLRSIYWNFRNKY
ncbi:sulfotransferase [Hyunsoonleella aestuarii]|uniref:Sulfotransferase family protein n=1 Tax=Hyunsoonleella aestuarii TaxID=912802 RepID=A0ABP8E754_9FLAO|nr:sulfotransferase [Hyunsoonleella aestuarii]